MGYSRLLLFNIFSPLNVVYAGTFEHYEAVKPVREISNQQRRLENEKGAIQHEREIGFIRFCTILNCYINILQYPLCQWGALPR